MPDDDAGRSERGVVVRGLGWSGIGYPLNVGLAFAAQVLAANLLTPGAFGSYALALSIYTSAALVLQLGLPHSLLRRASAALVRGDDAGARHEIVSAFAVGAVVSVVCGALIASPFGSELLEAAFPRTAVASIAVLIGIRTALRVLENLVPEALRAFRDFLRVAIYSGLLTNLVFCIALGFLLVDPGESSLTDVMLISTVVAAAALVPAGVAVARKLRATGASGVALRNPVEPAMWVSTIGLAFVGQLDLLVVGALGTSRELALYAAPFRLVLLVGLPLVAVNQVVAPLIAGWYAKGQLRRLERTLRATAGLALVVAALAGAVLVVGGGELLSFLFGPFYGDAWPVLVILTVGQVLQTWAGSCGFALLMTGNQRAYALILGLSLPLTLVLDVALYEVAGIEGVAIATAVMITVQNVVQMFYLRRIAAFSTAASVRAAIDEYSAWRRRPERA